jgi:hypothetical protein
MGLGVRVGSCGARRDAGRENRLFDKAAAADRAYALSDENKSAGGLCKTASPAGDSSSGQHLTKDKTRHIREGRSVADGEDR